MTRSTCIAFLAAVCLWLGGSPAGADATKSQWRFDCGTADSPVEPGYERLTAAETYSASRGYGWDSSGVRSADFLKEIDWPTQGFFQQFIKKNFNPLSCDGVVSDGDLAFRADVPNGTYRVSVTIGDMTQPLGSIDLRINGQLVGERLAAWSCGGQGGDQRRIMEHPNGFWLKARYTVDAKEGYIRFQMSKNQAFYDEQIPFQTKTEQEWENQFNTPPYKRVTVLHAPYYYCGWPFKRNSVMAIEIAPDKPLPVAAENDKLRLTASVQSPALSQAIKQFNTEKFDDAVKTLAGVTEEDAQPAKAVVALWLAGRLETDFDTDTELIAMASKILEKTLAAHPEECELAELLDQAKVFAVGWDTTIHSGDDPRGEKNHFNEKAKSITWFWQIPEGAPLYYQAQLNLARSEHMMLPYFPARGTYREVLKKLEKKFPNNRFVKYHLHEVWEPYGDGSKYHDWAFSDHSDKVKDSPEWVKWTYQSFQQMLDWSEWWIRFRQGPTGSIGGGWGDDVEIVAVFGYYGFVSKGMSDILVQGTAKLIDGLWTLSEVDQELGYCTLMADSEHSAEWTGNTLGMMVLLDYGNPMWIERAMKTAKLMRDLWTDYNDKGHRFFRAAWFGAAQVSDTPEEMDDFWIDYRAIRPASAVLWYSQNPAIGKLYQELGDSWLSVSLSTDRGKPRGVIPGAVSFPDELIGGYKSITWYGTYEPEDTGAGSFSEGGYKEYIQDIFLDAFKSSRNPKYLEPFRLEYELVKKYKDIPAAQTGLRLQKVPKVKNFGVRLDNLAPPKPPASEEAVKKEPVHGAEEWTAQQIAGPVQWLKAKPLLEGRQGALKNDMTKDDAIRAGRFVSSELKWRFPLHTTEAGPTDRIGFIGCVNPFILYTGGRMGGPVLEAAITYENTTRDFAALVLGSDVQGFRLLYHSLTPDPREVGIVPWHLERGNRYMLRYGPDADEDEKMDSVAEEREFDFPQLGTPITIKVKPRVTYIVEVERTVRGKGAPMAPDPALTGEDIRYKMGLIMARIHNVGSLPVRRVEVAAYEGDPQKGGKQIGKTSMIPNIQAPLDLIPTTTTIAFPWDPDDENEHDIYIVIDPNDKMKDEITAANNVAHTKISAPEEAKTKAQLRAPVKAKGGR